MIDKKEEVGTSGQIIRRHKKVAEALQDVGGYLLEKVHGGMKEKGDSVKLNDKEFMETYEWYEQAIKFLTAGVEMERAVMEDWLGSEVERLGQWLMERFGCKIQEGETPIDLAIRMIDELERKIERGGSLSFRTPAQDEVNRLAGYFVDSWEGEVDKPGENAVDVAIRLLEGYDILLKERGKRCIDEVVGIDKLSKWLAEKFPNSLVDGEDPVNAVFRLVNRQGDMLEEYVTRLKKDEPDMSVQPPEARLAEYLSKSTTPEEWNAGDAVESPMDMAVRLLKDYRSQLDAFKKKRDNKPSPFGEPGDGCPC